MDMLRKIEVALNNLRIGHSQISHSYLMNKEDPFIYQACGAQLSIKHILTKCSTYEEFREKANLPEHNFNSLNNTKYSINSIIVFIIISNLINKL